MQEDVTKKMLFSVADHLQKIVCCMCMYVAPRGSAMFSVVASCNPTTHGHGSTFLLVAWLVSRGRGTTGTEGTGPEVSGIVNVDAWDAIGLLGLHCKAM